MFVELVEIIAECVFCQVVGHRVISLRINKLIIEHVLQCRKKQFYRFIDKHHASDQKFANYNIEPVEVTLCSAAENMVILDSIMADW